MGFSWDFPYPSQRMPVLARNVVAASQPLAAQAGLRMLLKGGNAVDAALATAITLVVVEPDSNALGSDAFAIVWDPGGVVAADKDPNSQAIAPLGRNHGTLYGFNGSGRSPKAWTPERYAGLKTMPLTGWDTVTVPGAVNAWVALSQRFGRLAFADLFAPAIQYAREGYPVSPRVAASWAGAPKTFGGFPDFMADYFPNGRAPRVGEVFRPPGLAESLEEIAATKGESLYRGRLAGCIADCAKAAGGAMTRDDLAAHAGDWVEPLSVDYHGLRLHEIPPNGQGLAALIALGILRHLDLPRYPADSPDSIHLQVEAMKIAFADVHRHVADPAAMTLDPRWLLREEYLARRARAVSLTRARSPKPVADALGGTVYLAAADASGMMVSYIQSNYCGFGSGVVVPGTGICMQNRGSGFSLVEGHPNRVAGGKRPFHTIIPGFITRDIEAKTPAIGRPVMAFGVMGGHMQPQGHVQMMVRIFDYGQNPQAASDAPRWHVTEDFRLGLEGGFDPSVADELRRRGHVFVEPGHSPYYGGRSSSPAWTRATAPPATIARTAKRSDSEDSGAARSQESGARRSAVLRWLSLAPEYRLLPFGRSRRRLPDPTQRCPCHQETAVSAAEGSWS